MASVYHTPYQTVADYFTPADVHEVERVENGDTLIALVFSLLWTFLHGLVTYWVFWNELPFVYGLAIHAILTLVVAVATLILKGMGRDIRHLYILSISSAGAGVFGAAGTLLCTLLTFFYTRFSLPFGDWYRAIYPDFRHTHEETLYEHLVSGKDEAPRPYSVVSFLDVMALGSEAQKRRALTRMTDHFQPAFAPAYQRALQDESNTIRVQAAASIAAIEQQFGTMVMDVERLERRHPDDPILKLGLARFYDSYAFTGLLDEEREEENRLKALEKYREYLEMRPADVDARIEAGRLLLRSGDYDQVIVLLRDCMDAGYGTDTLKLWMLEALYASGRFGELRKMAPECLPLVEWLKEIRPRLARAVETWGGATT